MSDFLPTIKSMWGNGGRSLLLVALAATLVLALNILTLIWLWLPDDEFSPMAGSAYDGPQDVLGDQFKVGDDIPVGETIKCNTLDKPVVLSGSRYFRQIGPTITNSILAGSGGGVWAPHECRTQAFKNVMPAGVTPGTWMIVGLETATEGGNEQYLGWETERFEVVE